MYFIRIRAVINLCQILSLFSLAHAQKSLSSMSCETLQNEMATRLGRIIGGEDARRGSLPFIASLTRRGSHFCGATIINDQWLVTAAHCLCNGVGDIMRPNQIKAILGLHKRSEFSRVTVVDGVEADSPGISPFEIGFKQIVVHPGYRCRYPDHDIALLKLDYPIEFSNTVQPICIARATAELNNSHVGESTVISGWGYTSENMNIESRPDVLQKATVEVWSNNQCQEAFTKQKKSIVIKRAQMCAGKTGGGVDSCWSDSGGPMVTLDSILIGVVSTGIGCARPDSPGIYTRVSEYADWIENSIIE